MGVKYPVDAKSLFANNSFSIYFSWHQDIEIAKIPGVAIIRCALLTANYMAKIFREYKTSR
jgi:hypothetical protein